MDSLKSCPFCDRIPDLFGAEIRDYINGEWAKESRKVYWVQPRCVITCPIVLLQSHGYGIVGGTQYKTEEAAIEAWNRRGLDE